MRVAIYPGSFDPLTNGHLDIIKRAAALCDELIIAVLMNTHKKSLFLPSERVKIIEECVKDIPNVKVESFDGLLVDFAEKKNADFIVRGLRTMTDFEYEIAMAQTNHQMKKSVETVFLATTLDYSYISSSLVKEIAFFDGDISGFVPGYVAECIKNKLQVKE